MNNKAVVGQVFGLLKVTGENKVRIGKRSYVECLCDCGENKLIRIDILEAGGAKSCGHQRSRVREEHGRSYDKTYRVWRSMKLRCGNPKDRQFKNYGARGIKVCERWLHSYANFMADMGPRPEGLTLDRKNNNGNYEPDNCRWATTKEQGRNMRKTRKVNYQGKEISFQDFVEQVEMNEKTLYIRIFKKGWDVERAVNTPVNPNLGNRKRKAA